MNKTGAYKKYLVVLSSALIIGTVFSIRHLSKDSKNTSLKKEDLQEESDQALEQEATQILTVEEEYPHVIERNIPLYTYLTDLEIVPIDIIEMVRAAKPVKDLARLLPGTRFQVETTSDNNLREVRFRFSAVEKLIVKKVENIWQASIVREAVDIKTTSFVGKVDATLWESAFNAKMDPYLVVAMAEIFGWEVDFNREVRVGDAWRIVAEEKFVRGQHVGWGSILAAEYVNQNVVHTAVLFRYQEEDIGYYSLDGENLRKMFLKSPLRFGRVTSRFNRRRFHPKLKVIRPHYGVDYGAPIGTPVRSVADGVVTFARYSGGGGKVLKIRHNSTYQTAYKHLSRYAVRKGTHVKQGQVVAYVGNTGLSTGPHLHYEFYVNGRFVDPLKQKFPSADPISSEHKVLFSHQAKKRMALLPKWKQKPSLGLEIEKTWAEHLILEDIHKYKENFVLMEEPSNI